MLRKAREFPEGFYGNRRDSPSWLCYSDTTHPPFLGKHLPFQPHFHPSWRTEGDFSWERLLQTPGNELQVPAAKENPHGHLNPSLLVWLSLNSSLRKQITRKYPSTHHPTENAGIFPKCSAPFAGLELLYVFSMCVHGFSLRFFCSRGGFRREKGKEKCQESGEQGVTPYLSPPPAR